MNHQAVTLTRLIAVRLLWYVGVGAIALMALSLHTQFGVAVLLSAIAIYIPLSMLSLPLMAWLCLARSRAVSAQDLPPAWPGYLAGVIGIALLASYHVLADLDLAECGFLLILVAGDLLLARKESAQLCNLAQARA
jgi:NhaP-type Na+/H+ and K+/H+ antiporter